MSKKSYENGKRFILSFIEHYNRGNIGDLAATLAFYSLFAIFPLIIILGSLLQLMNLDADKVLSYLEPLFPESIFTTLEPIVHSTVHSYQTSQLSIGLIVAIWSASRAIAAFQRSINQTYGVKNQTAISNRILSFVWMLVLLMSVIIMMFTFIFGQLILEWLRPILNIPKSWITLFSAVKWPVTMLVLVILLILLFYFVPTAKVKVRYAWAGALYSSMGLLLLSQVFSIYINYFASGITAYKTIGTFIALMFWLDFSAVILLQGGVINATIQEVFQGEIVEQEDAFRRVVKHARKNFKLKKQ